MQSFNKVFELKAEFDPRESFYGKAQVLVADDVEVLQSYDTRVLEIRDRTAKIICEEKHLSPTTLRHIKELLKQRRFKAETKAQVMKDYFPKA